MIEKLYYIYKCRLQGDAVAATSSTKNLPALHLMEQQNKQEQVAFDSSIAPEPSAPSPPLLDLHPCGICGRTFVQKALLKHEQICQKSATKKRKPFNSLAQRVAGTDLADFHMKTYLKKTGNEQEPNEDPIIPEIPIPDEPIKIKELRKGKEKIPEKMVSNGETKTSQIVQKEQKDSVKGGHQNITPKRSSSTIRNAVTPQGEKCPSCDRNFGAKAFERHVEWCKERNLNKPQLSQANLKMAKERLAARTNYRAPQLNSKSQRQINKEKYSSQKTDKSSSNKNSSGEEDILSPTTIGRSPSLRRQGSVRKPNETEKIKKLNQKKEKSKSPSPAIVTTDPFVLAQQQMQQLILETSTPKLSTIRPKTAPCLKTELPLITPTKPITEETPIRTKYTRTHLVPGIDSPKTHFPLLSKNLKNRSSVIDPPMTFQDHFDIDPDLINSTDNLSIPEELNLDFEESIDLKDFLFSPLKFPSKPKQLKNREDVEKYLDQMDGNKDVEEDPGEELFNVDDELYAEYKQFEKLYLQEKGLLSGQDPAGGDIQENKTEGHGKAHGDSAYSSLNRSTSKEYNTHNFHNQGDCKSPVTSSSESDTPIKHRKKTSAIHKSLLNSVANPQFDCNDNSSPESRRGSMDIERQDNNRNLCGSSKLPKFCHECGSKYPVDVAKFCVNCGAKRLVLGF